MSVLALLWPLGAIFTVQGATSRLLLLATAALVAVLSLPLWSHLRRSPVDPEGVLFRSLDENLEDRAEALETLARRRTTYASDRRAPADGPTPLVLGRTRFASDGREPRPHAQ